MFSFVEHIFQHLGQGSLILHHICRILLRKDCELEVEKKIMLKNSSDSTIAVPIKKFREIEKICLNLKKIRISSILKLQLFQRQVLNRQKLNFMAKMFVLSIVYEKKSAESILFCLAFKCFQKYFLISCHSQIHFWKSNNLDLDFTIKAFRKGVWFYCTMKIKRMVILWFFRVINKISRNFLIVTAKR